MSAVRWTECEPMQGDGVTPIRIRGCDRRLHDRNSLNGQQLCLLFEKTRGALCGQKFADPAIIRIRLNIVSPPHHVNRHTHYNSLLLFLRKRSPCRLRRIRMYRRIFQPPYKRRNLGRRCKRSDHRTRIYCGPKVRKDHWQVHWQHWFQCRGAGQWF